jgi:tRNA threonylcarbamoyladenosine biosynthesis protein TsaB
MATNLLALDCSTDELTVAVAAGERQCSRVLVGGAQASSRIIGLALEGLADCAIGVTQLNAVAFGAGPGTFTGLRCACAVAQGLAYGLGQPVIAIDCLMLVAEAAREQNPSHGSDLWVAMDARMDEAYAACYCFDSVRWHTTVAPALYTLEALDARWRAAPPRAVAGTAAAAFGDRLPLLGATAVAPRRDRATALMRLAQQAYADGAAIDPTHARPLYLRDKVALTTLEREAAQRAKALAKAARGD